MRSLYWDGPRTYIKLPFPWFIRHHSPITITVVPYIYIYIYVYIYKQELCKFSITKVGNNGRYHYSDVIMSAMVSQNHRCLDCFLNCLFRRRSKKTSKLRVTGHREGNPPVTDGFPTQLASYAEKKSIWWRHHGNDNEGCKAQIWPCAQMNASHAGIMIIDVKFKAARSLIHHPSPCRDCGYIYIYTKIR